MKKRKLKKKVFAKIFIFLGIFAIIAGSYFTFDYVMKEVNGEAKYLMLDLVGDSKVIVKYNEEYKDPGAKSSYKDENLTDKIKVDTNIDLEHVGTYKYKYDVKYKNQEKSVERIIEVIDDEKPTIELIGQKIVTMVEGNPYKELGAKAKDEYDGDLTDKIEIDTSKLDTKKIGSYKVTYKVTDSSGNTTDIERTVNVVKKAAANKKIAVINYHFFYKDWSENCHEYLCLRIDRFEEQLKYLKDNGFYTLTIDEFVKWMYGELEIPEKSVLLTVDDGAWGTSKIKGNYLIPLLEKYQMHATLFLITGWWGIDGGIDNYKSDYLDVQSHTHNFHYAGVCSQYRSKVNCVSYDDLLKDLKQSIEIVKDTNSFCFPFYEYSETSIKAVKAAGFKVSFIGGYRKASRSDDKYKIPRYPIYDSTSLEQFKNMVN